MKFEMSKTIKSSFSKGMITAFRTLTAISLPGEESEDLSLSLPWFPFVGLILGLILYAIARVWVMLPFSEWWAAAALLILVCEILLTRGLHLDGLADWADSIGGFRQREKRLAIMKDANLGAFGVLALIIALMAKWLALERILASGAFIWFLVIFSLSRNMMVELITTLPYAREKEGMARSFVKGASPRHRFVSHIISLALCLLFGPVGLVFFVLAGLVTWLFRRLCRNQFGGITGDLLGTANEMVEIGLLIICALPGEKMRYYTGWAWVF